MQEVSFLAKALKAHLPWHQARVLFLSQFILALLRGRSTNLYRVVLTPAKKIDSLLADRKFIGREWFEWLDQQNILCRLRIWENLSVVGNYGRSIPAGRFFRETAFNQTVITGAGR
ncbi:hypothetical protein [Parendozoicomonas sp. Alg238-R29]|uniref:hypothetical protein n=1 Tax=Parendozoicomonas sp. Alg238-R29 TaxID=2993446 RepID=UPI00248DE17E|nr:hypothetical protein [Parendozoicomonas sp. Alg238-R29]